MSETPSVSSRRHDDGMTNTPEYPFKYIDVLYEQYREQAMKDVEHCAGEVRSACVHLVPRTTKAEFLAWAGRIWDEARDDYNDYLSSRHD